MMMDGELAGFAIPRLGMGTMALAIEGRPDRDTAIRTIHAGLDAGVRYLDTAWSYYLPSEPGTGTAEDLGYGEKLVRDALTSWNGRHENWLSTHHGGPRFCCSCVRFWRIGQTGCRIWGTDVRFTRIGHSGAGF